MGLGWTMREMSGETTMVRPGKSKVGRRNVRVFPAPAQQPAFTNMADMGKCPDQY